MAQTRLREGDFCKAGTMKGLYEIVSEPEKGDPDGVYEIIPIGSNKVSAREYFGDELIPATEGHLADAMRTEELRMGGAKKRYGELMPRLNEAVRKLGMGQEAKG
jgi:hypothetical protein